LRELGLSNQADSVQSDIRQQVTEAGYRLVIAGTPKEAFGLREALADEQVEIRYAGEYVAERAGDLLYPLTTGMNPVFFHPSEVMLFRLDGFDAIDRWLTCWLGDRYRREADPRRNVWPAAIERPSPRVSDELTRGLADQRLKQIQMHSGDKRDRLTILTCDPFSLNALRKVSPPNVEVSDLLVIVSRLLGKEGAVGT
jgi:hypothetical protein